MHKGRFSADHIALIVKELEAGRTARELSREYDLCEQTLYQWKSRYSGMDSNEIRLSMLEHENRRLKQLVANLTYERDALKGLVRRTHAS